MSKSAKPKNDAQLAAVLGVSRVAVCKHRKNPDAPKGRDIGEWLAYMSARDSDTNAPREMRSDLAAARLRLVSEQGEKLAIANAIKRKDLIEFHEVDRFIRFVVGSLFETLDRVFANEFPPAVKGKSEMEIHREAVKAIEEMKGDFRRRMDQWLKENQPTKKPKEDKDDYDPIISRRAHKWLNEKPAKKGKA